MLLLLVMGTCISLYSAPVDVIGVVGHVVGVVVGHVVGAVVCVVGVVQVGTSRLPAHKNKVS